jgi:diketogulonate reductase-like aldo/keto reductase
MPRLIYGTAWKKERTTDLVVQAILAGFRGIDTACQPKHYSEALVGDALDVLASKHNIPRESLFVQTKFTSFSGAHLMVSCIFRSPTD